MEMGKRARFTGRKSNQLPRPKHAAMILGREMDSPNIDISALEPISRNETPLVSFGYKQRLPSFTKKRIIRHRVLMTMTYSDVLEREESSIKILNTCTQPHNVTSTICQTAGTSRLPRNERNENAIKAIAAPSERISVMVLGTDNPLKAFFWRIRVTSVQQMPAAQKRLIRPDSAGLGKIAA